MLNVVGILNRIYGFEDVKVAYNGSWTIEQVVSIIRWNDIYC